MSWLNVEDMPLHNKVFKFFEAYPQCLDTSVFQEQKSQEGLFRSQKTEVWQIKRGQVNQQEEFEGWICVYSKLKNTFYLGNYKDGQFQGNGRLIDVDNETIKEGLFDQGVLRKGKFLDFKESTEKVR